MSSAPTPSGIFSINVRKRPSLRRRASSVAFRAVTFRWMARNATVSPFSSTTGFAVASMVRRVPSLARFTISPCTTFPASSDSQSWS